MMHDNRMGRKIETPNSPYFSYTDQFNDLFEEYPFFETFN
jgi:hypothetical protein